MYWRKAKSIRVCHPSPVARNCVTKSRERRMVMRSLVTSAFGRPVRNVGLSASHCATVNGKASGSDIAAAMIAASSVSVTEIWFGLSFGTASHLALVRLSQADDSSRLATGNEHQYAQ
jgi:hypothetical protein